MKKGNKNGILQRARRSLGNREVWIRRFALMIADAMVIIISGYAALWVRFEFHWEDIDPEFLSTYTRQLPIMLISMLVIFWLFRLYHSLWEFAGLREVVYICFACLALTIIDSLWVLLFFDAYLPRSYYPMILLCSSWGIIAVRFFYRWLRSRRQRNRAALPARVDNIMVIGAGQAGSIIVKEIKGSNYVKGNVCCLIDDDERKQGSYVHDVRVVGTRKSIVRNVQKYNINQIIIAMPSQSKKKVSEILDICKKTDCSMKVVPGVYQLVNGEVSVSKLRNVDITDLLGRDLIEIDNETVLDYVKDRVILVTGGGGSIGSELCRQISARDPRQLIILDIYENNAYEIQQELVRKYPDLNLKVLIGSVRNTKRVEDIMQTYRPEIVFHAAAHKHVPLMEDSPDEAIKNNVMGTMKMVQASDKWGVKKFVLISTDKAVNPTNIMGASKRLCEMIIQTYNKHSKTDYVAVRFGNVLGSNGSVIPLFKKQIAEGGPVTVTHPDIIRYFMTIPEAVSLVLQAAVYAKGGEIFVLDMGDPVRIVDLAKNLIRLSGLKLGEDIDIVYTGLRPGEKLYEELLMAEEGMQETPNKLIHIGKPIELNEETFFLELMELKKAAEGETKDIRRMVKQMVPTYQYENFKDQ